jgi:hypothetical protein
MGTPRAALALAGLAAVAAAAAGCGEDDRPASWSYIHAAIIVPSCTTSSCHTEFNAQAGVKLADREGAYAILLGRTCDAPPDEAADEGNLVVPGSPEGSRLMHLLIGEDVARAMPPDRLLPDADIDLIERWILEGAPCD